MPRLAFAPSSLLFALTAVGAACGDAGSGSEAPWSGGELAFAGEQPFLPGLDVDTGWLPDNSDVAVRATASASGKVTVVANATSDGETLTPVAGSGALALEGALAFEVSARIDSHGIMYEGIVDAFEYGINPASETFEPFALDAPVTVVSTLPAQELGSVPIPSVPGASLVMSVTGGELTTSFQGTCAEAQGGVGQYAGTITMGGTVACAASVEIEVPIVGPLTFGPFPFDVPIPAIASPIELGTLELASGEPSTAKGICDGSSTATGDGTAADETAGDDTAGDDDSGDASNVDDGSEGSTSSTATGDDTGPTTADPFYPEPDGMTCPSGYLGIRIGTDPVNGVCLPACEDSMCPTPTTGTATPVCDFNPDSTRVECAGDIDCPGIELCDEGSCSLPPSHCMLECDDVARVCPDAMACVHGHCSYLE